MKADFHIRSYESSVEFSALNDNEQLVPSDNKIKYLVQLNPNDPIQAKQMILAYKVLNDGLADRSEAPQWVYVDEILKPSHCDEMLFAVQYEGHENHTDYAEFPVTFIESEFFDALATAKFRQLNCLTHTLADKKAYQLSKRLSQFLLDFYHENKPPVIDTYDLEDDLLKNKAVKLTGGWQISIAGYQIDLLLQDLDENEHPIEIAQFREKFPDESIGYLNLDRRNYEAKLGQQASVDDDTIVSEPVCVEQLKEVIEMFINGGTVELIVTAFRYPNSNHALVGTLNLID